MLQLLLRHWRQWFGVTIEKPIPLDVCVLEDRVLYSATMMPVDSFESNDGSVALLEQLDAQLDFELEASTLLSHGENASDVDPFYAIDSEVLARIFETTSAQSTNVDEGSEPSSGELLEELGALLTSVNANETIDFLPSGSIDLDGESDQGIDTLEAVDALGSIDSSIEESLEIALRDEAIVEPVSHVVDHASAKIVVLDSQLDFSEALEAAVATDAKLFVYDSTVETASQVLNRVEDWVRTTDTQVSSLSILSHGAAGGFELGSDWITDTTVGEYLTEFNSLASYFSEDAKIYILGCNVVSDSQGQVLLDRLAEATGAEIYASSDITGFGGDWELESHSFNVLAQDLDELESILDLDSLKSTEVTLAWYNSSWNYRQTVTVDDAMVSGTSDLTNFTVLVNATQNNFKLSSSGGRVGQADGGDFVFTLADGTTKLSHQIESYNSTTGNLVAWVKLPTLAYNGDTSLFVYYGNATVADQWNAAGTWASDVRANYHLASDFKDSTGNANNATNSGTTAVANAKIAGGDQFNGISSKLAASDSNSLDVTGNLTVSGWFNSSNLSGYKALVAKGTSSTAVNYYVATKGTELQFAFYAAGGLRSFTTTGAGLTTGTWYNFALTYDDTANSVKFYLNGNQIYSATTTHSLVANSGALSIGTSPWNEWFNGSIDEIKVESTTKSAAWIQTQYSNQNSPGSYITLSNEQGPPVITSGSNISILEQTYLVTTLTATDPRFTNPTFSYSIVGGPDAARFVVDSATGALSFATAPIHHAPVDVGADNVYNLVVQVSSGTLTGTQSLTVSVNNVNDAPTIDAGEVYEFAVIDEDSTGPSGTLVSIILSSASYSDVDTNALSGIAVTSLTGVGEWQYSTDGISWTGFGTVMGSNALLLDSSTQIRFLPDGNNGETASLTYRAWDRTTGTASSNGLPQRTNATMTGGTTAFSDIIATSSITVTDLNDAPIITGGYTSSLPTTLANMISSSTTVGQLLASSGYSDVDLGAISGMAVTSMTGLGTWQYSTDGLSWRDFNQVSSSQALLLNSTSQIRYIAPNNVAEIATFTYRGWDQSLGTASTDQLAQYADASTSGLTSPFSEEVATANLTVIYINESPIAQIDTSTAIEAGGVSNSTGGINPNGNVLANDSDGNFGDQLTVVGVASGTVANIAGSVGTNINGIYGSLVLQSNGDYSYVLNNDNPDVQGLKGLSQTLSDTFTYTIHDLSGASSSAQLVFTIVGTNDTPHSLTGVLSIAENALNGTNVGVVSAADVDSGETFSYSLTDNAGGRFAINTATGQVTVANGSLLNFESASSHTIVVAVTDAAGATFSKSMQVSLLNVNESPSELRLDGETTGAGLTAFYNASTDTYYALVNSLMNWEAAMDYAQSSLLGGVAGSLVVVNSSVENTFLDSQFNGEAWIGGSDKLGDGVWRWFNGDSASTQFWTGAASGNAVSSAFSRWASGEPNGGVTERYALLQADSDRWSDADSTKVAKSWVEWSGANYRSAAGIASSVSENAVAGTLIATLATTDQDANESFTYSIVGTNSNFEIVGDQLRVKAGANLDYESASQHQLTLRVFDSGGNTRDQAITIQVVNSNEAPLRTGIVGSTNLITNGSFESGTTGWTISGAGTNAFAGQGATHGTRSLAFNSGNASNAGIASTSIATVAGQAYTVSFDLGAYAVTSGINAAQLLNFQVLGSTTLINETVADAGSNPNSFSNFRFSFVADSGTTTLRFADASSSTNAIDLMLDNVKMFHVAPQSSGLAIAENSLSGTLVGQITSVDPDAFSVLQYSLSDNAGGRFVIDHVTGVITVANGSLLDYESNAEHFITVRTTDQGGLVFDQALSIGLVDVNEAPTAVVDTVQAVEAGGQANSSLGLNPTGNVLNNDLDPDLSDTKVVVGVAAGLHATTSGSVNTGIEGAYGTLTLAADGSYSYIVANENSDVQRPRTASESLLDVFTYTMIDAGGLTSTTQITVTIQGANDTPTAVADTATAIEAGGLSDGTAGTNPTGNLLANDTDPDDGDTKSVSGVAAGIVASASTNVGSAVAGAYGTIHVESNGAYTYTVDNTNFAVQALRTEFDTVSDVFTYTMTDTDGLTSSTQITVTIQGANDVPTAVSDTAIAIEAGGLSNGTSGTNPTGNVLSNDADPDSVESGETKTVVGVLAGVQTSSAGNVGSIVTGSYGSISISSTGAYSYTVDNNNSTVQELRTSVDTIIDVFTYTMTDTAGTTSTTQITIAIQGANDAPVAVADSVTAIEAGGSANGTPGTDPTGNVLTNDTDIDSGDTKSVTGVAAGLFGSTSGSVATSVAGAFGSISISANGTYTYSVDNSKATVQALRTSGQSISDVFSYTVTDTDGLTSTTQITVAIQGANDAPIAVFDTATAVESGGVNNGNAGTNPIGNVLANDTDPDSTANGETKTIVGVLAGTQASAVGNVAASVMGSYGEIQIAANGSYTYTVDNNNSAIQALRINGNTLIDVFTYTMADAGGLTSTTQITITVQGANDAPAGVSDTVIATETGGVANGSAGVNPTGNVLTNDTDVDAGDSNTVSGVAAGVQSSAGGAVGTGVTGSYGSITINADGSYIYAVDNSNPVVQALRTTADNLQDVFTYTMVDSGGLSSTTQITVTIQGQNDVPHDLASGPLAVNENAANGTVVGSIAGHDVDSGDTLTYSLTDSAGGRFAINSTTGQVTVADGSLLNFEALPSHHITVRVTDTAGTSYDEQFTINLGDVNETPVAVSDSSIAVEAGGIANGSAGVSSTGNVLTNDTDVDAGDTKTVSGVAAGSVASASGDVGSSVAGSFGSITINSDGSYSYTVDNSNAAVQALRTTANTLQDVFTYTMVDSGGLSSTTQITVTIQGQNDVPHDLTSGALVVNENSANGTVVGSITGHDVDLGDTLTYSLTESAGGRFAINSTTGQVTVADGSLLNFEALPSHNITVRVTDTAGTSYDEQFTINLGDVNETPVAVSDSSIAVEAGGVTNGSGGTNPTGNVLTNDTDIDAGDTRTVSGVAAGVQGSAVGAVGSSVTGSYGAITINSDGSYSYAVDNSNAAVQALRTTANTLQDVYTYTMVDSGGLSSTTQITVMIQGQNDNPVAVSDSTLAVEAGGYGNGTSGTNPTGNVLTNDTDVDAGDTRAVSGVAAGVQSSTTGSVGSSVTGSYGLITINSDGSYSYTVDNSNATVQALRTAAYTNNDVFSYTVTDTAGTTSTTQITVTIQGRNDAPGAVDDTPLAVEAGGVNNGSAGTNPTGNLLSNDTDIDVGDSKTVTGVVAGSAASASGSVGVNLSGSYGSITVNADGTYSYVVDNSNAAVQALRTTANTLQDFFTYTMQDAGGLSSTATVTITIEGANDAPVAVGNTATAVEAIGVLNNISGSDPTGNVLSNDTDVDAGDTKTVVGVVAGNQASASGNVGSSVSGSYGSIQIAANGIYTYSLDNNNLAVEALNGGQTLTETFTYTVSDTSGATSTTTIVITIQGVDDLPYAIVDMDTAVEAGGVNNTTPGTSPSGNVLSNDIAPNGQTVIGVTAGSAGSASGSVGIAVAGLYGTVVLNADGTYTYAIDNNNAAVQALRVSSDHLTDLFTYTMEDTAGLASTASVTITIQGANDAPVAVNDNALATEAGGTLNGTAGSNPNGNVLSNDTDVDSGDTKAVSGVAAGSVASTSGNVGSSVTGSYGAIAINADGTYSYAVDNSNAAVQALRTAGDTLLDVFSYTMTDTAGATSTAQITITIQGANDTTVLTGDMADAVESGGYANVTAGSNPSGNVLSNDSDVDTGDSMLVSGVVAGVQASATGNVNTVVNGAYGSITIAGNGSYIYTVDNANAVVQSLLSYSDTLTDTFTYTVTDASGATTTTQIVVTVHGQNDGPTSVADSTVAVEAGGIGNGTSGIDATGNVLSNDTDLDSTANGETKTVSGVAAGVVASASTNTGCAVNGTYGSIIIEANGTYTYTVDNNNATVQALRTSSDTIIDVFSYTMTDAGGLTSTTRITVTIQGSNDAPSAVSDTVTAIEAGGLSNGTTGTNPTGNVLNNDTDPDSAGNGETKTVVGVLAGVQASAAGNVGSSVNGSYGAISISSTGAFTYTVDNSNSTVQALRTSGDTITDVFTYTMNDASGLASSTQITVTIRGENDSPILLALASVTMDENTPQGAVVGSDAASDVDCGDSLKFSLIESYGGAFAIDNTGRIFVNNSSLLDRESVSALTITVRVSDLAGAWAEQNIEVNLNDVDEFDVGTISDSSATSNSIAENAIVGTFVGIVAFASDSDATQNSIHYTLDDSAGGRFAIDGFTGSVSLANAAGLDFETANSHTILVRASSSDGSTITKCFTIALTDVNETAEALPVFDGSFNLLSGVGTPNPLPSSELPPLASILEDNNQGICNANAQEIAVKWNWEKAVNYLDQILQPAATAWTSDNMFVGRIGVSFIESTWGHGTEDYELNEHDRIYVGFMNCENLSSVKSLTDILFGSRSGLGMRFIEQNSESTFYGLSDFTWDDLVPIGVCSVLVIWSAYVAKLGSSLFVSACGGFFVLPPANEREEKKAEQRILRRVDKFH